MIGIYSLKQNIKSFVEQVEQLLLGGLGQPATHRTALYLLQKLLKVALELLSALHASVTQQAPPQQSLPLPTDLLPEVLLGELYFVLRVHVGDFCEAFEWRVGSAFNSEEEVEDAFGIIVGFLEEAPHALSEMDGGIVLGIGLVDGDAHLQCGYQVLLEVVE